MNLLGAGAAGVKGFFIWSSQITFHDGTVSRAGQLSFVGAYNKGDMHMGDRGGQRDKDKGQKQRAAKDAAKQKKKRDKQAKAKQG